MSFGIYAVGFLLLLAGLLYVAHLMHVPTPWMIGGALVILGAGLMSAVKNTRQKDPAA